MFGRKKEKEKETNSFGDKNYSMKNTYNAEELYVANLQRVSSAVTDLGPMIETTDQKYIFEKIIVDSKIEYKEVFTGFTTEDENDTVEDGCNFKYFDLPYVYEPKPFTDYFPETIGIVIPKLSLICALNDINYSKDISDSKQLKKMKK